jgi:glycosyltransferase involved in cell wall biosynthesis
MNWTVRASASARRLVRPTLGRIDALLVHTQTAALGLNASMRSVPTLISVDATPEGWDSIGTDWGHKVRSWPVEEAKKRLLRRTFSNATGIVAWSSWVAGSLEGSYGVPPERVLVLPAGVTIPPPVMRCIHEGPVRLLFVGRDFTAKGGDDLLDALDGLTDWELDVVTHSQLRARPGVRVHRGLTSESPELAQLYREADIAVLPSHGDCSPFAILEAMAAGLPVIATRVGAVGEIVQDRVTGFLSSPHDVAQLRGNLESLISDRALRGQLGKAGRRRAEEHYDANRNANALFDLLVAASERRRLSLSDVIPTQPC